MIAPESTLRYMELMTIIENQLLRIQRLLRILLKKDPKTFVVKTLLINKINADFHVRFLYQKESSLDIVYLFLNGENMGTLQPAEHLRDIFIKRMGVRSMPPRSQKEIGIKPLRINVHQTFMLGRFIDGMVRHNIDKGKNITDKEKTMKRIITILEKIEFGLT